MASTMTYCFKIFLFTILVALFPWTTASNAGTEEDKCLTCHDSTYNKTLHKALIHRPFLDKKCLICHVAKQVSSLPDDRSFTQRSRKDKITWLQKHYEPARTHFFLVPSSKVDDTLFIQSADNNGRPQITSIDLPPLQQLPQLTDDQQPPKVSNIEFLGIKRGILRSATISWKTDEPSDAQIHYGIGTFGQKTRLDPQLKSNHTITISPITPGKTYTYTVISKDMHGNRTISQPLTFSSKDDEQVDPAQETSPDHRSSLQAALSHQLAAVGDRYFVTITANWPTFLNIGTHPELRPRINLPVNNDSPETPVKHVVMKDSYDTNITSCLFCHKNFQSTSNHPINIGPKRGMIFPDDYPVLADGKMHCMTCHDSHASDNVSRIRRRTKQELCIGCHKNYD